MNAEELYGSYSIKVPKEVTVIIEKGQYGINFIDKDQVIREDPVDFKTSCTGFLKLKTLSETFEKSIN